MSRFDWFRIDQGEWACHIGPVTLIVTPDVKRHNRPAYGTKWHAQCTHWNAATATASRFGRDVYLDLQPSAKAAKRLAEQIYTEAAG
jgi:hypothetical protein